MTRVALITMAFPFHPGEQFLEEELEYWAASPGVELVVMPLSAHGQPRPMPANVRLDTSLSGKRGRALLLLHVLLAVFKPFLWRELLFVLRAKGASPWCFAKAFQSAGQMLLTARRMQRALRHGPAPDLVYTYWNDTLSLGAALLKRQGLVRRLVTRIHNYELYEEEMRGNYIPLKHQFAADFDRFFTVSDQGRRYLLERFPVQREQVVLSRLGVTLPPAMAAIPRDAVLHAVSISYVVDYKRVELIIEALARLAEKMPELQIQWTHIGDGPLLAPMRQLASRLFAGRKIRWEMPGQFSNTEVRQFLENQPLDVLLNASKNEGVPVAVMEAMSCGIPAIAPAVGGVAELVSDDCGCLLKADLRAQDLAQAIIRLLPRFRQRPFREAARRKIERRFDASANYRSFLQLMIPLAASRKGLREKLAGAVEYTG